MGENGSEVCSCIWRSLVILNVKADDEKILLFVLLTIRSIDGSHAAYVTRHVGKKLKQDLARSPKMSLDGEREGWGWGGVGNFPRLLRPDENITEP